MTSFAVAYGRRGEFARATVLQKEILACRVLSEEGKDTLNTLTSMNNLDFSHRLLREYSREAALFAIQHPVLGAEHMNTLANELFGPSVIQGEIPL